MCLYICPCCSLYCVSAVDLQSKITPSNGKKVTAKDFNTYLAANKVRHTPKPHSPGPPNPQPCCSQKSLVERLPALVLVETAVCIGSSCAPVEPQPPTLGPHCFRRFPLPCNPCDPPGFKGLQGKGNSGKQRGPRVGVGVRNPASNPALLSPWEFAPKPMLVSSSLLLALCRSLRLSRCGRMLRPSASSSPPLGLRRPPCATRTEQQQQH